MAWMDKKVDASQDNHSTTFHASVLAEQTSQLYAAHTMGVIATVLNALILSYVLSPVTEHSVLFYWLTALFLIAAGRTTLAMAYKKAKPSPEYAFYWKQRFFLGAFLSAATWGTAAIFLFPEHDPARQVFLAFVIGGTAAGAITSLSYISNIIYIYLAMLMFPLITRFLISDSDFSVAMGSMLTVYTVYIFSSAKRSHTTLLQNISLRIKATKHEQELIDANIISENANQAKSQFLSHMSHELRTPINAMLGFAQLLEMDIKNEQHKDSVKEILHAGNHLIKLIDQILDLSKIEAGSHEIELNDYPLNDILHRCITLISPMAANHNIEIINTVRDHDYPIYLDKTHFTQVMLNLISNAIKYNNEDGTVTISCRQKNETTLEINISDSGAGLTQQQIESMFTPFVRLPEHKHLQGTGIGLAICKRLIEAMNGTLGISSTLGVGSTATLTVPLSQPAR